MADGSVKIDVGLDITKAERDLEKLKDKINKAERQLSSDTARKSELEREIEKAGQAADAAREKIKKLKEEYKNSRGSERASVKERLDAVTANYRDTVRDSDRLSREYQAVNDRIDRSAQSLTEMREQAGAMAREIESARPGEALARGFEYAKKKLWTFLKYAVGIRSVYILFRRLRSAIKDAVSSFAEHDAETKGTIDALKSSLEQLKMSWGAAFASILNAVAPPLQKLIGWLTDAANSVSRFVAILSGKSTYKRVVANTEAVAGGMEDVSQATDEAKKSVMGFDELNILNGKTGGASAVASGAGTGGKYSVVNEKINEFDDSFLDRIARKTKEIIDTFRENFSKWKEVFGKDGAGLAAAFVTGLLETLFDLLFPTFDERFEEWKKVFGEDGAGLATAFIAAFINAIWDNIKNWFDDPESNSFLAICKKNFEEWKEVFGDDGSGIAMALIAGFIEGLWKDSMLLTNPIYAIFSGVINLVKKIFGIHSPSTVFYDIAQQTGQGFLNGLRDKFSDIKTMIKGKLDEMKQLFNVTWSFPKIKMPHFSWTWQKIGKYVSIPNISVSWYAKGGVFDMPSMIGVGENGKEAVVPLEKNTEWMRLVADGLMDRLKQANFANQLAEAFMSVPRPAMAGGGVIPPGSLRSGSAADGVAEAIQRGLYDAMMAIGDMIAQNRGETVLNINGREFMRATYDDFKAVENEHGVSLISR